MVSKYQSSVEIAVLKQTIHDEAYDEAAEAFAYTMRTRHMDWDLAYLGAHMANQITEWRTKLQANQPPVEECRVGPPSLAVEPQVVPPPPHSQVGH